MSRFARLHDLDNTVTAKTTMGKGEVAIIDDNPITLLSDVPFGYKVAAIDIKKGEQIYKQGHAIGVAKEDIPAGTLLLSFNVASCYEPSAPYEYHPEKMAEAKENSQTQALLWGDQKPVVKVYRRKSGKVGIRNSIWILALEEKFNAKVEDLSTWGTKSLGLEDGVLGIKTKSTENLERTMVILSALAGNPNAGGVLVLGTEGRETFQKFLGAVDESRIFYSDNGEDGETLLEELAVVLKKDKRTPGDMSEVVVGIKCSNSNALSGATANSIVGYFTDEYTAINGTVLMGEIPDYFGAEQILLDRAADKEVYNKVIKAFTFHKDFATGDLTKIPARAKISGVTTSEEMAVGSLGKAGNALLNDVLFYGEQPKVSGLNLLNTPSNNLETATALLAAGSSLIIYTTGAEEEINIPVPTITILAPIDRVPMKNDWTDYDAGAMLKKGVEESGRELFRAVADIASGLSRTKNENTTIKEIAVLR